MFLYQLYKLKSIASLNEGEPTLEAPVLESAVLVDGSYILTYSLPNGALAPEGGYDTYINGLDQNDWETFPINFTRTITELDTSIENTFFLESRYTQLDPVEYPPEVRFPKSNSIAVPAAVTNVTSVSVLPSSSTIAIGVTEQLTATVLPVNANVKTGVWSSSVPSNATVDQNGLVTAVSDGASVITFTADDTANGTISGGSTITVLASIPVISVSVTPPTVNVSIGGLTQQLTATFNPTNAADKTGVWSSNNANATVDSVTGVVTAVTEGSSIITFTANDTTNGTITDTSAVTVSAQVSETLLAFPSAIGAGAYATGGRGGKVCHVNTLVYDAPAVYDAGTDSYSGGIKSLALLDIPAKQIVFEVAGTIVLPDYQEWNWTSLANKGNITFNGQTAPGKIVLSTDYWQLADCSNVVFRYMSFYSRGVRSADVMWIYSSEGNILENVIVDHCSYFYGGDECLSISSTNNSVGGVFTSYQGIIDKVTIQHCLMGASSKGSLIGSFDGETTGTMAYTVFMDTDHRFPNMYTVDNGQIDCVNNFVGNYGNRLNRLGGNGKFNTLNNYYQPNRADYGNQKYQYKILDKDGSAFSNTGYGQIHSSGNIIAKNSQVGPTTPDFDAQWQIFASSDLPEYDPLPTQSKVDIAFPLVGEQFTIHSADEIKTNVVPFVGNNKRLSADGSVINDSYALDPFYIDLAINKVATTDYYRFPATKYPDPTSGTPYVSTLRDGIPDTWRAANLSGQAGSDLDPTGYSYLERFLNEVDN